MIGSGLPIPEPVYHFSGFKSRGFLMLSGAQALQHFRQAVVAFLAMRVPRALLGVAGAVVFIVLDAVVMALAVREGVDVAVELDGIFDRLDGVFGQAVVFGGGGGDEFGVAIEDAFGRQ